MKMSLCNTFRFFAVSTTIVLSIVGSPVPGSVSQQQNTPTIELNRDLQNQESIIVELKSNDKRANDINSLKLNNVKDDIDLDLLDSQNSKKNVNKTSHETTTSSVKATHNVGDEHVETTTPQTVELITEMTLSTNSLNITLANQKSKPLNVNKISEDKNNNPVNVSWTIQPDLLFQNNVSNKNQMNATFDGSTTIELDLSTVVTLTDIKENTTVNPKIDSKGLIKNTESTMVGEPTKSTKTSLATNVVTTPTWKKYTTIERKRVPTTTDKLSTFIDTSTDNIESPVSTISDESTTVTDRSEVMVKSESVQGRISLQDAITSDIPSLERLKSDLLSFSKFNGKSDTESTTPLYLTEGSITNTESTAPVTTTFPSTSNSESPNTVASKRAGYLDLTAKNTTSKVDVTLKPNYTDSLQGPFDAETPDTQDESSDDKVERRVESQSQLAEDAIKEELLKEEMLNDNEEISKRHRVEEKQKEVDIPALPNTDKANTTEFDDKLVQPPLSTPDENLSVRPINSDKTKNTVLYPVNPNYKPLKKIEVQPAKPFVRDPDDNSWRNESLSSLGIVFKPKNSSKPFTQVLKNKTETEWNNLPEKDIKSEVPDLRVRLEQIAQKRKSKKKKIDSFGNVFYTDYEENSSSEENTSTPNVEELSTVTVPTSDLPTTEITIVTPIQTTSSPTFTTPASEGNDSSALTTIVPTEKTQTTSKKQPARGTTLKRPKMFNLFDYYETNDDEDIADYLNMAKIDLKKYTVPIHTTYTPYTSPPLPILYTNPMTQYTAERKGTIQYFPPRTTKRPKKHKHKNVLEKVNPLTLTDSPKHVLPISYHKLTTPYDGNAYHAPDMRFKDDPVTKNFDRNFYLTTPPLTTIPDDDFGVIGNDGGYNRPNYVIKHYKDYINAAAREHERDKQREYAFTEPPAHDAAVTDVVEPTTAKDKSTPTEDYDYESEFRKDLLDRFVANFNDKSNRFKSDFPVVYNNSIVHGPSYDDKDVATSRAYFRRPYDNREYRPLPRDPYDPSCENVTVELSPAYELHYYVPEQEEKQEVEAKPIDLPARYRL